MLRRMGMVLCAGVLLMLAQDLARAATDKPLAGVMNRRFMLVSEDGDYTMRLTGRVHFKGQFAMGGPADERNDTYLRLRRTRTGVEGKLAKYYQYKIEYDFGSGSGALTDGFLGLTHFDAANIRMGRYKVPFGAEELISSNSIRFVERSMINRFAPSRRTGIDLRGKAGDLGYAVSMFDGTTAGEFIYAGRFTMGIDKFTIGANALTEKNEGLAGKDLVTFRSGQGTTWFSYEPSTHTQMTRIDTLSTRTTVRERTAKSDGSRTYLGADIGFWGKPFSFMAEFNTGSQDVELNTVVKVSETGEPDQTTRGRRSATLNHTGFTVQAGYVLTGENASQGGVTPARDFDPETGGTGAFELMARYSQVAVDKDALAKDEHELTFASHASIESASEITVGMNWYMSRHAKLMLNYVQTSFDSEVGGEKSESGVLLRMQLNY